jgi:hypothetical protein
VESRFEEVQGIDFSKVQVTLVCVLLVGEVILNREENQRLESTPTWIRGARQITETIGKILCLSCSLI